MLLPSLSVIVAPESGRESINAPGISGKSRRLVARTRTPSGPQGSTLRISPFRYQLSVLFSVERRSCILNPSWFDSSSRFLVYLGCSLHDPELWPTVNSGDRFTC